MALLFSLATMASACGEDEEEETPTLGTCDLRSVFDYCIEVHSASPGDFENQVDACAEAGGDWSTDACQSDELIGCCDYVHGNEFRQCFYVGYTGDAEGFCTDGLAGVWTPAN